MSVLARAGRRIIEPVWLGEALSRAKSMPEAQADAIRGLILAARRRARAARALGLDEHDIAALALERDASALAISALVAARGSEARSLSHAEAWTALDRLDIAKPDHLARTRELFGAEDPLALDRLTPKQARAARVSTERTLRWLLGALEPRTPRAIRVSRVLRVALAAVVIGGGLPLAIWWLLRPPNLAIQHPVAASSLRPGTPKPEALTDGNTGEARPVMTLDQDSPWFRVDLLDQATLERIVLHVPPDPAPAMFPLVIELSQDDQTYSPVATLERAPAKKKVWRLSLAGRRARYVRLRHPGAGHLAFHEIEVFGRK